MNSRYVNVINLNEKKVKYEIDDSKDIDILKNNLQFNNYR